MDYGDPVAGDPKLVAKIALQYQLATREQLTECMRLPEAQSDLAAALCKRGVISVEQQAWLAQAEAYYAAQSLAAGAAAVAQRQTGLHRAVSTPSPAAAERTSAPTGAAAHVGSGGRPSAATQRAEKAELEAAYDAPIELDASSVAAGASARARLRARDSDAEMAAAAIPSTQNFAPPSRVHSIAAPSVAMASEPAAAIAIAHTIEQSPSHVRIAAQRAAPVSRTPVAEQFFVAAPVDAAPVRPTREQKEPGSQAPEHRGPARLAVEASAPQGRSAAVDALLTEAVRRRASDIHLHAGLPPLFRIDGQLAPVENRRALRSEETETMVREILSAPQIERFQRSPDLDFSYAVERVGRFRANAYRQQHGADFVFRAIAPEPPTLDGLGLTESMARFTDITQGLLLFTGPSGCGKTTTMSSLIDHVNRNRALHIITLETPIEYFHVARKSVVNQRQIERHTESYARGLRAALREDPNLIAIGEMREFEVIELALNAAETGSLVMATLTTASTIRTLGRLVESFPAERQSGARTMLAESLRGVISQRLVRRADGKGRVAALEIMLGTSKIAALIREDKQIQIRGIMQVGRSQGMRLLDDSLRDLVTAGTVTKEEARLHAELPASFA